MDPVRSAFRFVAQKIKREPHYALDPALTGSAIVGIVRRSGTNFLRGLLGYRWRFASTNGPFFIGRHVTILNPDQIHIGRNFKAEDYAEIQGLSRRGVRFGDGVTIGRNASIRPSSYYGNELGEGLTIGDGSSIGPGSFIGAAGFVQIGRNVMTGPRIIVLPENHLFERVDIPMKQQGTKRVGILIEDDCWIGADVAILDGVTVGKGSIVATGAVVTRAVPEYSVVGGIPARVLRRRRRDEPPKDMPQARED